MNNLHVSWNKGKIKILICWHFFLLCFVENRQKFIMTLQKNGHNSVSSAGAVRSSCVWYKCRFFWTKRITGVFDIAFRGMSFACSCIFYGYKLKILPGYNKFVGSFIHIQYMYSMSNKFNVARQWRLIIFYNNNSIYDFNSFWFVTYTYVFHTHKMGEISASDLIICGVACLLNKTELYQTTVKRKKLVVYNDLVIGEWRLGCGDILRVEVFMH